MVNPLPSPLNEPVNEPVAYEEVKLFKLPVDISISSNLPSMVKVVVAIEPLNSFIDDEMEPLSSLMDEEIEPLNSLIVNVIEPLSSPIEDDMELLNVL